MREDYKPCGHPTSRRCACDEPMTCPRCGMVADHATGKDCLSALRARIAEAEGEVERLRIAEDGYMVSTDRLAAERDAALKEVERLRGMNTDLTREVERLAELVFSHRMKAVIPPRALLYTDTIGGDQICRDDMWAVTTKELNKMVDERDDALAKIEAVRDVSLECLDATPGRGELWRVGLKLRAIIDGKED